MMVRVSVMLARPKLLVGSSRSRRVDGGEFRGRRLRERAAGEAGEPPLASSPQLIQRGCAFALGTTARSALFRVVGMIKAVERGSDR
jgi:hypothetical protein